MPKSKKTGKKYVPRIKHNPLLLVSINNSLLEPQERYRVIYVINSAVRSTLKGEGDRGVWDTITNALNVMLALDLKVFGSSHQVEINKAMQGHLNSAERYNRLGSFGYTGEELQDINTALLIHEAQVEQITVKELTVATDYVHHMLRTKNVRYRVETKKSGDPEKPDQT